MSQLLKWNRIYPSPFTSLCLLCQASCLSLYFTYTFATGTVCFTIAMCFRYYTTGIISSPVNFCSLVYKLGILLRKAPVQSMVCEIMFNNYAHDKVAIMKWDCNHNGTSNAKNLSLFSHHIRFLIVDVILNALWGHPPDGDFLIIPCLTLHPAVVVSAIHVLCQSKVSHFDHSMLINPVSTIIIIITIHCTLYSIDSV